MFQTLVHRAPRPHRAAVALMLFALVLTPRSASIAAASPSTAATRTIPAAFDRQFIDMMVSHHQSAVAMAQVALMRAGHPQIKSLARSIIAAQQSEIGQMKTWRMQWYGSAVTPTMMPALPGLPMGMNGGSMRHDITTLRTARPFDRAFIDAMTPHHELAIAAATLELAHGSHPQLKALALSIIKSQSREAGLMAAYRELWYGSAMGMTSSM